MSNYATKDEIPSLNGYATETYVTEQISNIPSVDLSDYAKKNEIPDVSGFITEIPEEYVTETELSAKGYLTEHQDLSAYAKTTDIPTTLPANGGNSTTVNGHTVKSDVPENAKFTDTVYDDTEVKESIDELNSNLDALEYSEVAGGKNILDITQNYKRHSNGILSVSGNKVTITGKWYCYYIIDVEENTDYYISGNVDSYTVNADCAIYNEDVSTQILSNCLNKTFNSGNNTKIAVLLYGGTYDSGTTVYSNLMIEKGTTATPYEPYIPSIKMLAEEVSAQKNDLDTLNSLPIGSIIQIEAAKDNIETTTQKYGWQYLGTSNIECNDGSVKLLVTNVYRKNN